MGQRYRLRSIFVFIVLISSIPTLYAQKRSLPPGSPYFNGAEIRMDKSGRSPAAIRFKEGNRPTVASFLEEYRQFFSFPGDNQLRLRNTLNDRLGQTHYRFNQYYKGIEVLGGEYILHETGGYVRYANGRLIHGLDVGVTPALSEQEALGAALNAVGAEAYMWENKANEDFIKREQDNPNATFYPQGVLKITPGWQEPLGENCKLVYRFDIYAATPLGRYWVDVNAMTGEVLNKISRIHDTDVPGSGASLYNGTVNMTVDQLSPSSFRLQENTTRGAAVRTFNMNNGTNYNAATNFTAANANGPWDAGGVSGHFGAEVTYDYYFNEHGRNSLDDAGFALLSYVHFSVNYVNAFWDGSRMTYGDGNGTSFTPLISLDVVGHELTHGVTEFSANLIYQRESGALNESFSDIFGNLVEFEIEGLPGVGTGNWRVGEDITTSGLGIRNMMNPNEFGDPDTYGGTYWVNVVGCIPNPNTNDNCGVHTNSGVQNFWFYLLVQGGSGTNDNGDPYTVSGIGTTDAGAIAYRNLTMYLTANSTYDDARSGSIDAATDLFGDPSTQLQAVKDAWDAVGVYGPPDPPDIDVSPSSFTFILAPGGSDSGVLTISNLAQPGSALLNWLISEQEATLAMPNGQAIPVRIQPGSGIGEAARPLLGADNTGNTPSAGLSLYDESARDDAPLNPERANITLAPDYRPIGVFSEALLYDNGPLVNSPGSGSGGADESMVQSSLGMTILGLGHQSAGDNRIADDFTVSNPSGWSVDSLVFYAYQTNSSTTSTITAVYYQIWDGPPNNPGSSVVFGNLSTNRLTKTEWADIYRVTEATSGNTQRPVMKNTVSAGFSLQPGTYWIVWQANGTLGSGPWAPPITINGQTTTGNALQYIGSSAAWQTANDGGTATQQGFPFLIYGEGLFDCPWLAQNPVNGSISGGGSQQVNIMVDATGLTPGVYDCNLVISSNDPDENPLTVPVQLTVTTGLIANVKAYLEGPYNSASGTMNTYLRDNGLLPVTQPFGGFPWNYGGAESVGSVPAGVVDWVLLELQDSPGGSVLSTRAAFIKNDGLVVDMDGSSPVDFLYPPGNYHAVVRHRNHLDIMSAGPVPLNESSSLYDFTTPGGQAYGTNPMKEISPNVYGMFAGDGNSDGSVTAPDREDVWSPQNGTDWDYTKFGDFNLDGGIDATDLNIYFRPNENSGSAVPAAVFSTAGNAVSQ